MGSHTPETAADPDEITAALPSAPGIWVRTDYEGGLVEYTIPGSDRISAVVTLVVRPEPIEDSAVRLDRKRGRRNVGTDRFEDIESACEVVERELGAFLRGINKGIPTEYR